ncbi:MAG: sulfotransferase family 2 domain-containing protein [Hyphomonadaceae bacterium]|nr:sulfotransferase family 2 domain-containing protein [Hyphomonadaceae bacterium]
MISDQHRAIFIHIQKTGGTSVSLALGGGRREARKHWTAQELRRAIEPSVWATYYKFAFVRNPWARLLSWWTMLDAQRERFEAGQSENPLVLAALPQCRTFTDFLERMDDDVVSPKSGHRTNIWRNQIDYLIDANGALLVDFVGRTETLAQDIEQIRPHLAAPLGAIGHENAFERSHYSEIYTPALRALVAERYASDIAHFGYTFAD